MKDKNRIISLLMAVCMAIVMLPVTQITANAASWKGSDFTSGTLAERLDTIIKDGISDRVSPVAFPKLGSSFTRSGNYTVQFYNSSRDNGGKWTGSQCIAYAYAAYNYLFHWDTALDRSASFSKSVKGKKAVDYTLFQSLGIRFGAYIRTTPNKNGSYNSSMGHSMLILAYDEKGLTTLDAIYKSASSPYYSRIKEYTWDEFNEAQLSGKNRYVNNILQPPASVYDGLLASANITNYTVTFNANGGSVSPTTKTITAANVTEELPTPTRSGYTFVGWSTVKEGSGVLVKTCEPLSQTDQTLYAHWRADTPSSTLSINLTYYPTGTLTQGNSFTLQGTATSNYKITEVYAEICDIEGAVYSSSTETPNSTSYPGNGGKFAKDLKFENLQPDRYILIVRVEDEFGNSKDWTREFSVTATQTSKPPATPLHVHTYERDYEVVHPHRVYMVCTSCGDFYYTDDMITLDSCKICNPSEQNTAPTPDPWSPWTTTPVTASTTREVETRQVKVSDAYTEYRYGRYVDPTGKHDCWCATYFKKIGYTPILQYSDWSTTQYNTSGKAWTCGKCGGTHIGADHVGSDGRLWWAEYLLPNGSYYWRETRTIPETYQTQYRYRDLQ